MRDDHGVCAERNRVPHLVRRLALDEVDWSPTRGFDEPDLCIRDFARSLRGSLFVDDADDQVSSQLVGEVGGINFLEGDVEIFRWGPPDKGDELV